MAVFSNIKGTTSDDFKIGKGGTTLYQGSVAPASANNGDYWFDSAGELKVRLSGSWVLIKFGNLSLSGNTLSATNTDGSIVLLPNGTGNVQLGNLVLNADQSVGASQDGFALVYNDGTGEIQLTEITSGTVTSVAVSGSDGIQVDSGSPITGSGTIALGIDAAALRTHINVEDGANNYTHPNHTGQVTSTGDGATVLTAAAITAQTALTTGLASTDELLVSDGGVLSRMDVSVLEDYMQANLTFGTGTVTSVAVSGTDGIEVDSGSPITGAGTITLGLNTTTLETNLNHDNLTGFVANEHIDWTSTTFNLDTSGTVSAGNITIDTNTISSTNTNGDISITPNGTGEVVLGTATTASTMEASADADAFISAGAATTGNNGADLYLRGGDGTAGTGIDGNVLIDRGVLRVGTISSTVDNGLLSLVGGTNGNSANIEMYGSTHPTQASNCYYDSKNHIFRTGTTAPFTTQRMIITDSGEVGISTINPTAKLEVIYSTGGSARFGDASQNNFLDTDGGTFFRDEAGSSALLINHGTKTSRFFGAIVADTLAAPTGETQMLTVSDAGIFGKQDIPGASYWDVSPGDATDIYNTNSGDVAIGHNAPNAKLHVKAASPGLTAGNSNAVSVFGNARAAIGDSLRVYAFRTATTATDDWPTTSYVLGRFVDNNNFGHVEFRQNAIYLNASGGPDVISRQYTSSFSDIELTTTECKFFNDEVRIENDGDIHADGNIFGFSTTTSSDIKLKKDLAPIENALDKINSLQGYTYTMKKNDERMAGLIAQDVEKVLPEAVKYDNVREHKNLDYNAIIGLLVEAVKELQEEIKELKK